MPDAGKIEIDGVSVVFRKTSNPIEVLSDIRHSIPAGRRVAIIGPSGSGKTTLLRVIAGLTPPSSGSVMIDGEPVIAAGHRPNFFGMMFQEPTLLEWRTVLENVRLPFEMAALRHASPDEALGRARQLLDLVGLGEFADFRPAQLSGGMKQRVALARSLITDPSVLLLDEPFSALDFQTRQRLWGDVDRLIDTKGVTTVLVTHSIEEAVFLSDTVVVLSQRPARIIAAISPELTGRNEEGFIDSDEFMRAVREVRRAANA